jgi:epoxide hydrolase 4
MLLDTRHNWAHRILPVNDIHLHVVESGSGPLVLLLHGFPEFWYSWRHQVQPLADAGFHAVAVDLRGYNESSRPTGVFEYRTRKLVDDIASLIDALGGGPSYVVGHDWGGVLAWRLAALIPRWVRRLVVINAPHPAAYRRELRRRPSQWLRSSYAMFFQLPSLPEQILSAANFALLERTFRTSPIQTGTFTDGDIREYTQALRRSGLTGPLNYYRAAIRWPGDLFDEPQAVLLPALLLWGDRDPFLNARLSEDLGSWIPKLVVQDFSYASHWLQNEAPDEVNAALLKFFGNSDA